MKLPDFPTMDAELRRQCLNLRAFDTTREIVIDTDTKNEIDDQFAVAFALLSTTLRVGALYAGQFSHKAGPTSDVGMEQSYQEILKILELLKLPTPPPVYRGNKYPLDATAERIEHSEAVDDLIARAKSAPDYIPVVSIGAPTNTAAALLRAPEIASKILFVWLGGHEYSSPEVGEYNLMGDLFASRTLFHSKIAMVRFPAKGVTSAMRISAAKVIESIRPFGEIGAFLSDIFMEYTRDYENPTKEIWDLATVAVLESPDRGTWELLPMPELTATPEWKWPSSSNETTEASTHCVMTGVDNEAIFQALSERLEHQL